MASKHLIALCEVDSDFLEWSTLYCNESLRRSRMLQQDKSTSAFCAYKCSRSTTRSLGRLTSQQCCLLWSSRDQLKTHFLEFRNTLRCCLNITSLLSRVSAKVGRTILHALWFKSGSRASSLNAAKKCSLQWKLHKCCTMYSSLHTWKRHS